MNNEKSLPERVAAHMAKKNPIRGAQNRATFLALKPDIEQTLKQGWPVKSIWETLFEEEKIKFSYQAFCKYVNSLIKSPPLTVKINQQALQEEKQNNQQATQEEKQKKTAGFTFKPIPNDKELF